MSREPLFDRWASRYDQKVQQGGFPFEGYSEVLDAAADAVNATSGQRVVELGVGTGNLLRRLSGPGIDLWGTDFSGEMLARAADRVPSAKLVKADLLGGWPIDLPETVDRIVCAYVLHEFQPAIRERMIAGWMERLAYGGRLVVADIGFMDQDSLEEAQLEYDYSWDPEDYYWVAQQALPRFAQMGLRPIWQPVSRFGFVLSLSAQ